MIKKNSDNVKILVKHGADINREYYKEIKDIDEYLTNIAKEAKKNKDAVSSSPDVPTAKDNPNPIKTKTSITQYIRAHTFAFCAGVGAVATICCWAYKKYKAYKKKQELIEQDEHKELLLDLSDFIIRYVEQHKKASISMIADATKISRNTIKKHLAALVKQGHLKQHGQGRSTWYTLA